MQSEKYEFLFGEVHKRKMLQLCLVRCMHSFENIMIFLMNLSCRMLQLGFTSSLNFQNCNFKKKKLKILGLFNMEHILTKKKKSKF